MSGSQKVLKVISIILIVLAAIALALGVFMVSGSLLPDLSGSLNVNGDVSEIADVMLVLGVATVFSAVVNIVIAVLGLRGAKNPSKIGPFFVLSIIGTVWYAIGMIGSLARGMIDINTAVNLVVVVVCLVLALNIKKQNA